MKKFGLIGKTVQHSFSKNYFENKWNDLFITDHEYNLIEIHSLDHLKEFLNTSINFSGINITMPYKISIISLLDSLTPIAKEVNAVNCIKKVDGQWIGHNTDALAFLKTLKTFLPFEFHSDALVLGSGGASRAVQWALRNLGLPYTLASNSGYFKSYEEIAEHWNHNWKLIINTTPLGMLSSLEQKPKIPYDRIDSSFYLYDLIYNPEKTLFLKFGEQLGAKTKNGLEMLHLQADESWLFWNE